VQRLLPFDINIAVKPMLVLLVFGLGALGQGDLVRLRQVNLNRAAKMPNLIADETAVDYVSDSGANWRRRETNLCAT
jgi:hypothetical protein